MQPSQCTSVSKNTSTIHRHNKFSFVTQRHRWKIIPWLEAQCTNMCTGGVQPSHLDQSQSGQARQGKGPWAVCGPAPPTGRTPGRIPGQTTGQEDNLHTRLLLYRIIPLHRWGNWREKRLSILPKVTHLVNSEART